MLVILCIIVKTPGKYLFQICRKNYVLTKSFNYMPIGIANNHRRSQFFQISLFIMNYYYNYKIADFSTDESHTGTILSTAF